MGSRGVLGKGLKQRSLESNPRDRTGSGRHVDIFIDFEDRILQEWCEDHFFFLKC